MTSLPSLSSRTLITLASSDARVAENRATNRDTVVIEASFTDSSMSRLTSCALVHVNMRCTNLDSPVNKLFMPTNGDSKHTRVELLGHRAEHTETVGLSARVGVLVNATAGCIHDRGEEGGHGIA